MNVLKNFIVLEGIDGSGTTTLLRYLSERMVKETIPFSIDAEPRNSDIGNMIRKILSGEKRVQPETLAMLFSADRREHLYHSESGIITQINDKYVFSDRYLFSSLAYQTIDCGWDFVYQLNSDFPLPEHLIFIDLPTDIAQERIQKRGEKPEIFDPRATQNKIRDRYMKVLSFYKNSEMKIHILDGRNTPQDLLDHAWSAIFS